MQKKKKINLIIFVFGRYRSMIHLQFENSADDRHYTFLHITFFECVALGIVTQPLFSYLNHLTDLLTH